MNNAFVLRMADRFAERLKKEAGDDVGMGVGKYMSDVQRPTHRWRWRIDGVDVGARARAAEAIGALALPTRGQRVFKAFEHRFFRDRHISPV